MGVARRSREPQSVSGTGRWGGNPRQPRKLSAGRTNAVINPRKKITIRTRKVCTHDVFVRTQLWLSRLSCSRGSRSPARLALGLRPALTLAPSPSRPFYASCQELAHVTLTRVGCPRGQSLVLGRTGAEEPRRDPRWRSWGWGVEAMLLPRLGWGGVEATWTEPSSVRDKPTLRMRDRAFQTPFTCAV